MTRRRSFLALLLVFAVALGACGSKSPKKKEMSSDVNAPDWYLSTPNEDGKFIVAATSVSSRMGLAVNKAKLKGKRDLAAAIKSTLQGQRERYVEEIGNTADEKETQVREQYQDLIREMVDQELSGVKLRDKVIKKEDGNYRVYVLMELSVEDFKNQLSDKEELKTRFNAKQFEDDMEKNLQQSKESGQ
ncbi:MAG: LPP20 family lipoprotein [bacterium]